MKVVGRGSLRGGGGGAGVRLILSQNIQHRVVLASTKDKRKRAQYAVGPTMRV